MQNSGKFESANITQACQSERESFVTDVREHSSKKSEWKTRSENPKWNEFSQIKSFLKCVRLRAFKANAISWKIEADVFWAV